jgi:hypothetical protein
VHQKNPLIIKLRGGHQNHVMSRPHTERLVVQDDLAVARSKLQHYGANSNRELNGALGVMRSKLPFDYIVYFLSFTIPRFTLLDSPSTTPTPSHVPRSFCLSISINMNTTSAPTSSPWLPTRRTARAESPPAVLLRFPPISPR